MFAQNLLHGFYSPPEIDLRNGPDCALVLMPFVALNLPLASITILNAVFHYLSIILLFKALQQIVSFRTALIISLFWACYYVAYQYMSAISYEPISIFLVSLSIFCLTKAFVPPDSSKARKYIYLSGFVLGYLALTKVIFGYVLFAMLIGCLLLWLIKKSVNYKKGITIILIACATTVPYLIYTYHVTGKLFYWGTGEENLYWMTTPYNDEYGDWKADLTRNPLALGNYNTPDAGDSLVAHHQKDFNEINKYTGLQRDEAYKKIAINNIRTHPLKYSTNIFTISEEYSFIIPFSYAVQRPKILFVLPINGVVLTLSLLCFIPTIRNWRRIIYPIRLMLCLTLLYLGACSLISSETRVFALIVPVLFFWVAYIFHKSVRINLKFYSDEDENVGRKAE